MAKVVIPVACPIVGEEEVQAVRDVLLSGNYTSGRKVKEFEEAFAEFVGTSRAVAVSNGTAALHIALEAMEIGEGDEVIVPPITFFASISSILYVGATPVFCDIDPDDLCLSPDSLKDVISPRTKAVMPVHLFGASAKMEPIMEIVGDHELSVLEDCAQSHGTK